MSTSILEERILTLEETKKNLSGNILAFEQQILNFKEQIVKANNEIKTLQSEIAKIKESNQQSEE
jgi:chromosome segregation ATPase